MIFTALGGAEILREQCRRQLPLHIGYYVNILRPILDSYYTAVLLLFVPTLVNSMISQLLTLVCITSIISCLGAILILLEKLVN